MPPGQRGHGFHEVTTQPKAAVQQKSAMMTKHNINSEYFAHPRFPCYESSAVPWVAMLCRLSATPSAALLVLRWSNAVQQLSEVKYIENGVRSTYCIVMKTGASADRVFVQPKRIKFFTCHGILLVTVTHKLPVEYTSRESRTS